MILEDQLHDLALQLESRQVPITVEEVVARMSSARADDEGAAPPDRSDDVVSIEAAPSYLESLGRRDSGAQADEVLLSTGTTGRRRRSIIIEIAAAMVLVAVGTSLLLDGDDTIVPDVTASPDPAVAAETPSGAELTAREYLDAWAAFDSDRAISYLTEEALADLSASPELVGSPDGFRLEIALLEALGTSVTVTGCEPIGDSAAGVRLHCGYDFRTIVSDELGTGPYLGNFWDLTVRDGMIVSADRGGPFVQLSRGIWEMWEPFTRWMGTAHPPDIPAMYDGSGWRLDEESVRLWEQYSREFVDSGAGRIARGVGLLGLPPEGAEPSTPETGELVVRMYSHASAGGDAWLFVYADGRVITSSFRKVVAAPDEGELSSSAGFLEQRLTPEGIDLVRAEVLSTGLFDPDQPPSGSELGMVWTCPPCMHGNIEVLNGGQLVYVPRRPGEEWTGEFDRLLDRLRELESWLPESAWQDDDAKLYVPSRFEVCLSNEEMTGSADPHPLLSLLPASAADLLADARHWVPDPVYLTPGDEWYPSLEAGEPVDVDKLPGDVVLVSNREHCFDLTTDQARMLAGTLEGAGAAPECCHGVFGYGLEIPGPPPTRLEIGFTPFMPHGEVECACYG